MKLVVMVFAGLLMMSSGASASSPREYKENKTAYCEQLRNVIVFMYQFTTSESMSFELRDDYLDRASKHSNIYNAVCKD